MADQPRPFVWRKAMSENWKDLGISDNLIEILLPGGHKHLVEGPDGKRQVFVGTFQSVGEAIANGQFTDDDDDD